MPHMFVSDDYCDRLKAMAPDSVSKTAKACVHWAIEVVLGDQVKPAPAAATAKPLRRKRKVAKSPAAAR